MSLLRPIAILLLCASAAGCSSSNSSKPGSGGSSGSLCTDAADGGVCVSDVTGTLTDATGAVLKNAPVSVCGNVCFYGEADADGHFDVPIKLHIALADYFLLIHQRPLHACFYYPLTGTEKNGVLDLGKRVVLTLPTTGPALQPRGSGAPAQNVTSGDVTLSVPAGVDVALDAEDVALGATGLEFRALTVPANERSMFVDPSVNALALYAIGPFEAAFYKKGTTAFANASLTFKNTTGLAAGTAVELLGMGSYLYPTSIKPGAFGVIATGEVSADGQSITLDAGQGPQYLTWFALRKKN
jgi:hypothetical protein